MIAWRNAQALDGLKGEIDTLWPARAKGADGGIGDEAHQAEGPLSDHNPHIIIGAGIASIGVVTARDFDVRLTGTAADAELMQRVADIVALDPRTKYVIYARRINYGHGWEPYFGADPHTGHMHVSVAPTIGAFDNLRPWLAGYTETEDDMAPEDRALLTECRRMLACLVNPEYAAAHGAPGEYRVADQVLMLGNVPVRPYRAEGPTSYNLETALSELLALARDIRDALAAK